MFVPKFVQFLNCDYSKYFSTSFNWCVFVIATPSQLWTNMNCVKCQKFLAKLTPRPRLRRLEAAWTWWACGPVRWAVWGTAGMWRTFKTLSFPGWIDCVANRPLPMRGRLPRWRGWSSKDTTAIFNGSCTTSFRRRRGCTPQSHSASVGSASGLYHTCWQCLEGNVTSRPPPSMSTIFSLHYLSCRTVARMACRREERPHRQWTRTAEPLSSTTFKRRAGRVSHISAAGMRSREGNGPAVRMTGRQALRS